MTDHPFCEAPPPDWLLDDDRFQKAAAMLEFFRRQAELALVVGQTGFTGDQPNQGGFVGPSTLARPAGGALDETTEGIAYFPDTDNHRNWLLHFGPDLFHAQAGAGYAAIAAWFVFHQPGRFFPQGGPTPGMHGPYGRIYAYGPDPQCCCQVQRTGACCHQSVGGSNEGDELAERHLPAKVRYIFHVEDARILHQGFFFRGSADKDPVLFGWQHFRQGFEAFQAPFPCAAFRLRVQDQCPAIIIDKLPEFFFQGFRGAKTIQGWNILQGNVFLNILSSA